MASSIPAAAKGGLHSNCQFKLQTGKLRKWVYSRNEDGGSTGTSLLDGVANVGKDGKAEMCLASFLGVCASYNLGT